MREPPADVLATPRDRLLAEHLIHEFDSELAARNAEGCYGRLVRRFYARILRLLSGRRVIDCGAGFGMFCRQAREAGFEVTPIDIDDVSIELAQRISGIAVQRRSVYDTGLPSGSMEVAACFDSIQHFELRPFVAELDRLGVRQLVVYDSNVHNPLLRAYRRAAGHEESHDRSADELVAELSRAGFRLVTQRYENFFSLPVSGGFQRRPLPILERLPGVLYALDRMLEPLLRLARLDRLLAFRFLLVFERPLRH